MAESRARKTKRYRSLIGGAIGDLGFEPGDIIEVPAAKEAEWLEAGLIEPLKGEAVKVALGSTILPTDGGDD